ncbi:hypothetical protein OUZ56_020271 [Daphnia magna]|uniref:Uncharacterized protein n=1 Tax=Daphnia magna TaxID=35525 RepID=A0ABQ9ZE14_9CRUS|nr:hypothetical protein OUZ56_020271 [Daphnia magna]
MANENHHQSSGGQADEEFVDSLFFSGCTRKSCSILPEIIRWFPSACVCLTLSRWVIKLEAVLIGEPFGVLRVLAECTLA